MYRVGYAQMSPPYKPALRETKLEGERGKFKVMEDLVMVREYDEKRDKERVEEMERHCELAEQGKPCLITCPLGDPLARIRHVPTRIMMVAECGGGGEIVGVVRGCIKTVTRGIKVGDFPIYAKLAYVLGLRVSHMHRQKGVATKLVKRLEEWFKDNGAEYVYMMTDCSNEASINLFTHKFNYVKFHTPIVLVQPVHAHRKPIASSTVIVRVSPQLADSMYQQIFSGSKFFPKDIDSVLSSKLHLGTFICVPKSYLSMWDTHKGLPPCFAIMSVWNTKEVYQLQLKGVSKLTRACCLGSRVLDAHIPWLRVPSIPNLFKPFGFYFLYGLHMQGKGCLGLMKNLCNFAHNMAREDMTCGAVVAEVAQWDPVHAAIPHWKKFSCEDQWCMKKLFKCASNDESLSAKWTTRPESSSVLFADPRDF